MSKANQPVQLSFEDLRKPSGHGGWRPNAGRPKGRSRVAREEREEFPPRFPQHVTLNLVPGLPTLRRTRTVEAIRAAIAKSHRVTFRIVEFEIESNHIHMITEASCKAALSASLRDTKVAMARALNELLDRTGPVFDDRYHVRLLKTPREVRNALRYVLLNHRHHMPEDPSWELDPNWIDPCSSAYWFEGWRNPIVIRERWQHRLLTTPPPTLPATTWLLAVGWRRWGLLAFDEMPQRKSRGTANNSARRLFATDALPR